MNSSNSSTSILFILPDCPGFFVELAYKIAKQLKQEEIECIFAVTSPYYKKFKKVPLEQVGTVHYFSEFLQSSFSSDDLKNVELDYWLVYPTFVRQRYFLGKHANQWDTYRKTVLFYRYLFEKYRTLKLVWSEPPSCAFICVGYSESKKRQLPFLGYQVARVPGFFNIGINLQITKMLKNPTPPSYIVKAEDTPDYQKVPQSSLAKTSAWYFFKGSGKKLWQAIQSDLFQTSLETGTSIAKWQIKSYWKIFSRKFYYDYLTIFTSVFNHLHTPLSEDINFLFPLHYRPEASTSVLAPFYEDDLETIKNIAFSLPHGAYLYVKEHSGAVGNRSLSFYKEILTYPNVRLMDIDFPVKENWHLLNGIVTLTSTMGFEASQQGVPVLLLGRVFYENYPGVRRIQSWEQLRQELASVAKLERGKPTNEPMERYLEVCFQGSFNYMADEVLEVDNIEKLILPIKAQLNHQN
ncbi:capsular polysaccharide export protein, LipB/KpsS family [Candidatus Marithrix sp. Canyon 246]|uniref:capsular polysaccharide export protein, LipB/KpsS family n=1 Tax=Candidatus Marithrix sp. Canyon 246 TaxID=1827136 RepID=UPI00084A1A54|nr:hypothetical protein [Candidatus Marithrix sp. Canyon 246]